MHWKLFLYTFFSFFLEKGYLTWTFYLSILVVIGSVCLSVCSCTQLETYTIDLVHIFTQGRAQSWLAPPQNWSRSGSASPIQNCICDFLAISTSMTQNLIISGIHFHTLGGLPMVWSPSELILILFTTTCGRGLCILKQSMSISISSNFNSAWTSQSVTNIG